MYYERWDTLKINPRQNPHAFKSTRSNLRIADQSRVRVKGNSNSEK